MYSQLSYLLPCWRFAQHLKCLARDLSARSTDHAGLLRALNDWITRYVDADPKASSEDARSMRPLASALVQIEAPDGLPGGGDGRAYLRPEFQLPKSPISSLRLILRGLPARAVEVPPDS